MTPICCPYCHSEHVSKQNVETDAFKNFEKLFESISPSTMAAMGIKLAKSFAVPPYIGGVIGLVVGGTLIIVSRHLVHKYSRCASYYSCNACLRQFAMAH